MMSQEEFEEAVVGKSVENVQFGYFVSGAGGPECTFDCLLKIEEDGEKYRVMVSGQMSVNADDIIESIDWLVFRDYENMDDPNFTFEDAKEIDPDDIEWCWAWDELAKQFGIEVEES